MAEKKAEFVVTDRRRFGSEGDPRPDAPVTEEEKTAAAPPATPPVAAERPSAPLSANQGVQAPASEAATPENEEIPAPPTPEEQHEQHEAYKASGKKIDDLISASGRGAAQGPMEMSFERVIESFYMSALIQMGAVRQGNEPPQVDIIGARQTIDSLTILQEKTKGNLSDREKTLMQNVLFELRMAWIELTNAIATSAMNPGIVPPGAVPPPIQK